MANDGSHALAPSSSYAKARAAFRTKLTREGPAPQSYETPVIPLLTHMIRYRSGELELQAWVSNPPADGHRQPGLIFLHGGFAFGDSDWEMARPFREADFAVLMPALRGENGLPGQFTLFFREVDDVLAAAEVLGKLPYVYGDRLYVAGHSVGGTLAILAALESNRFSAVASFSGTLKVADLLQAYPEVPPFDQRDPEELRIRSPSAFAADLRRPARLFCGDSERRCKAQSEQFARSAGPEVRAVSVPGDHFSAVPGEIAQAISFFRASPSGVAPVKRTAPSSGTTR